MRLALKFWRDRAVFRIAYALGFEQWAIKFLVGSIARDLKRLCKQLLKFKEA